MRSKTDKSRGDSRNRIVQTAARLMKVQGYHGTGLNQIIEESEAPKGSLYHYFSQGKEELFVEAIDLATEELLKRLGRILQGGGIRELVDLTIDELTRSDYRDGCPLANVALETASQSEALQRACSRGFQRALALVERSFLERGAPPEQARRLATTTVSAYEGALLLSRVHKDPEPLRIMAEHIRDTLMRELPRPNP